MDGVVIGGVDDRAISGKGTVVGRAPKEKGFGW
jgi:hypothetical protein